MSLFFFFYFFSRFESLAHLFLLSSIIILIVLNRIKIAPSAKIFLRFAYYHYHTHNFACRTCFSPLNRYSCLDLLRKASETHSLNSVCTKKYIFARNLKTKLKEDKLLFHCEYGVDSQAHAQPEFDRFVLGQPIHLLSIYLKINTTISKKFTI